MLALRARQARNFMAILMLSQGLPMILSGDEMLRSQRGNNNAWCQNNDIGWLDWNLMNHNHQMLAFTKAMIALRKRHPSLRRRSFLSGEPNEPGQLPDIQWQGERTDQSPWDDPMSRVLCFTLAASHPEEPQLHVMMNMSEASHSLQLPQADGTRWRLAVDTAAVDGRYHHAAEAQPVAEGVVQAAPRSVLVFEGS